MLTTVNATDMRKDMGGFLDAIVHEKPMVLKRSRDRVVVMNLELFREILSRDKMNVRLLVEEDGTTTAVIEELDLMTNAPDAESAVRDLAEEAVSYAQDYYKDFVYWHSAPNRKAHLPFILSILACRPDAVAEELFVATPAASAAGTRRA